MILFEKKNERGETIATNFNLYPELKPTIREKEFFNQNGSLRLISDEQDLINSSSVLKRIGIMSLSAFDSIYDHFKEQIKAQSHSIKKIQGNLIQKAEGIVQSVEYTQAQSYQEEKESVLRKIRTSPEEAADGLIFLYKRAFELGAHIASFEILHLGEQLDLDIKPHNLRRLLTNILKGFEEKFYEINLKVHIYFNDDHADNCKILADYKTINAAFYNLFDNIVKYATPDSEIRFYFWKDEEKKEIKLILTTRSLKIDQDELSKVFELGYRSRNAKEYEGSGIGMYVIKKALELNNISIEIRPNYSDMKRYNNEPHVLNEFIFYIKNFEE